MRTNRRELIVKCLSLDECTKFIEELYKFKWYWTGDSAKMESPVDATTRILEGYFPTESAIYIHVPIIGDRCIAYSTDQFIYGLRSLNGIADRIQHNSYTVLTPNQFLRGLYNDKRFKAIPNKV